MHYWQAERTHIVDYLSGIPDFSEQSFHHTVMLQVIEKKSLKFRLPKIHYGLV